MSSNNVNDLQERLRNRVGRGDMSGALKYLQLCLVDNDDLKNQVINLVARLTTAEKNKRYNAESQEDYNREIGRIHMHLLDIVNSFSNDISINASIIFSEQDLHSVTRFIEKEEHTEICFETPFSFYERSRRNKTVSAFINSKDLETGIEPNKALFAYDFLKFFAEGKEFFWHCDVEKSRLLLLAGHPGYGKTFYCKKLANEFFKIKKHNINSNEFTIPYYYPAKRLSGENDIHEFCQDTLGFLSMVFGVPIQLSSSPCLIIIDGITESGLSYNEISHVINKLSTDTSNEHIRYIVTSRSFYFLPNELKKCLTIFLDPIIDDSIICESIESNEIKNIYNATPMGLRVIPGFFSEIVRRFTYNNDLYDLFFSYMYENLDKISTKSLLKISEKNILCVIH